MNTFLLRTWIRPGKSSRRKQGLLAVWMQRSRDRHHLAMLDDHLLADIGLDRARVLDEVNKPFWRS